MDWSFRKGSTLVITLLAATVTPAHALFSGAYLGLNAGYSIGRSDTTTYTTFKPATYFLFTDVSQINNEGSKNLPLHDFIGGIQAGYNYRSGNGVIGLEADFNSMSGNESDTRAINYITAPESQFTLHTQVKTKWLATLRPRIGYVFDCTLIYLTGGLAVAPLKTFNSFTDDFDNPEPSNVFESASASKTKAGGVIGAGFEYAMTNNLSLKGEYLYTRIDHVSSSGTVSINQFYVTGGNAPEPFHHKANFVSNIFRIGINYNFC